MTNDLLPCPFNHKHELERYITGDGTMVSCCSCGIEMHVDQWNTRANKPAEVDLDDSRSLSDKMDDLETLSRLRTKGPVDIEGLKHGPVSISDNKHVAGCEHDRGWNDCIDYLHASGHLATGKGGDLDIVLSALELSLTMANKYCSAYVETQIEEGIAEVKKIRAATDQQKTAEPCGDVQAALDWLYEKATAGCTEFTDQLPDNYNTVFMALKQPAATAQIDAGELGIPDGYALVEKEYLAHVGINANKWLDHLRYNEEAPELAPNELEHDIAKLIEVTDPNQMRDEYRIPIKRVIAAARAHLEKSKGGV